METTPIIFKIEIQQDEWYNHPLRKEWNSIHYTHPLYGPSDSFLQFLKQQYNINMEYIEFIDYDDSVYLEFKSEQDYTLWILHQ